VSNSRITPATLYRAVLLAFGLAAAGLIIQQIITLVLAVLIVPIFTREVHQFARELPGIVDALRRRLGRLTGTPPRGIDGQLQHFVNTYTQHPSRLLGRVASISASVVAAITAVIVVLLTVLYSAVHPQPLAPGLVRMAPPSGALTRRRSSRG
jgi:predicted PurR-regulated permease PerM